MVRWKLSGFLVLALLLAGTASPARAQVTYAAEEGKLPFTVGAGASYFSDDWGIANPHQVGFNVWADWRFRLPSFFDGLGVEFEGRDVNYATPSGIAGHRMDTALGGPIYQWRKHDRFRPYVKYLIGIGSIDYPAPFLTQSHDTATVFAPAGGIDIRVWRRVSVRAEYEYQYWHHVFGDTNDLTPNGFSFGAVYDFGGTSR
jgi:opacity protein-like surface antigen